MGEKHTFWAIFGDVYRYTLNVYRYTLHSGRFGQCVPVHFRGVSVHPVLVFLFQPVFVFWPYLAHFLSDLSDSSGQLK